MYFIVSKQCPNILILVEEINAVIEILQSGNEGLAEAV